MANNKARQSRTTADDNTHQGSSIQLALRERVKELNCLYTISRLQDVHFRQIGAFLQGVVDCLPPAWQYPEVTCARLCYGDAEYCSAEFAESPWRLSANIHDSNGDPIGCIEAYYRKAVWGIGEDPFLPEEHTLIRDVADRVSRALKHMKAESELRQAHLELEREHKALQEVNIALRSVMSRLEEDKRSIQANILSNIRKILMPMVFELELEVSGRQRSLVTLLRQNLHDIASPFLTELTQDHTSLSPTEITVCAMIRNGMSTKEIARLRCISVATVRRHRENIRRKLGLRNRKVNLVSHLQSMASASLSDQGGSFAPEHSTAT